MVYDALNRPIEITYPQDMSGGRKKVHPEYNKAGALEKLKFAGAAAVSRIAYNAKGQRTMMVAGGLMTRYAYNTDTFRLTRIRAQKYTQSGATFSPNGNVRLDRGYSYDLIGSVTKVHDKTPGDAASRGPNDEEWIYQHDPLRRLISATGREHSIAFAAPPWENNVKGEDPGQTNTYTRKYIYDKQGNILELDHKADLVTGQDFTREFNYDTGTLSNRLQSFDVTSNNYSYSYDANGNLIQENTDRYFEWNYADKLAFFKRQAGGGNPSVWVHYLYDNEGNRIKKTVNKASNVQEVTVYIDGMYEYSYTKNSGTIDSNRQYNTLHILDGTSRVATVRVGNDADDSTPAQKFFVEDHLGNASVVVQTNGNRINLEEYYPFGETSFGSYQYKRYRYNGKEKDEHTGLYEYGQRYYAPWLCRFVSVDPVAEDYPQLSSYNYAGNKPLTSRDIEGLQSEIDSSDVAEGTSIVENTQNSTQESGPINEATATGLAIKYGDDQTYYFGSDNPIPDDPFVQETVDSLRAIMITEKGTEIVNAIIENNQFVTKIEKSANTRFRPGYYRQGEKIMLNDEMPLEFNPHLGLKHIENNEQLPPFISLAHEIGHAYRLLSALQNGQDIASFLKEQREGSPSSEKWKNPSEENTIKEIEWPIAKEFGSLVRENYSQSYDEIYNFSSPTRLTSNGPDLIRVDKIEPQILIDFHTKRKIVTK